MKNDCNCCNKKVLVGSRGPQGLRGQAGPQGPRAPQGYSALENSYYAKFNVNFYPTTDLSSGITIEMKQDFGTNNLITLDADNQTINLTAGYIYSVSYVLLCSSFEGESPYTPITSYIEIFPTFSTISLGETLATSASYGTILNDPPSTNTGYNGLLTCSGSFITNAAATLDSELTFVATIGVIDETTLAKVDFNGTISIYPIAKL